MVPISLADVTNLVNEERSKSFDAGVEAGKEGSLRALKSALEDCPLDAFPKDFVIDIIDDFIKRK